MADNVTANAGSGGATFRAYADSGNLEHPAGVVEYATTVSAGANVLQPVTPSNGLPVQPATGAIFTAGSYLQSDAIYNAATNCTPQFSAPANVAASTTDSVIVSGTSGTKIRVLAVACICGATATAVTFNDKPSGAGTAITPQWQLGANGGFILPFSPIGWFQTSTAGDGLSVTTGSGSTTGIQVTYILV